MNEEEEFLERLFDFLNPLTRDSGIQSTTDDCKIKNEAEETDEKSISEPISEVGNLINIDETLNLNDSETNLVRREDYGYSADSFEIRSHISNFVWSNIDDLKKKNKTTLHLLDNIVVKWLEIAVHDFELMVVLKANGWKYKYFDQVEFNAELFSLSLSNLFLKSASSSLETDVIETSKFYSPKESITPFSSGYQSTRDSLNESKRIKNNEDFDSDDDEDEEETDAFFFRCFIASQTESFCPNILIDHFISKGAEKRGVNALEVSSSTFHAACMLVDISGFSKFSSSMCSKGVTGLDDLHKVTNDFLGHFVDVVYQYHGDGKLHSNTLHLHN